MSRTATAAPSAPISGRWHPITASSAVTVTTPTEVEDIHCRTGGHIVSGHMVLLEWTGKVIAVSPDGTAAVTYRKYRVRLDTLHGSFASSHPVRTRLILEIWRAEP